MGWFKKTTDNTERSGATHTDALHLIRDGKISEGRDILWSLCRKKPINIEAHIVALLEFYKEPRIPQKMDEIVKSLFSIPDNAELQALFTIAGIMDVSAQGSKLAFNAYETMINCTPHNPDGAALCLMAEIAMADLLIQAYCREKGDEIPGPMVTSVMKGVAGFVSRKGPLESLQKFRDGYSESSETVGNYEKFFGFPLTNNHRNYILEIMRSGSILGQALMLRDMGKVEEGKVLFREFNNTFRTTESVKILINEV